MLRSRPDRSTPSAAEVRGNRASAMLSPRLESGPRIGALGSASRMPSIAVSWWARTWLRWRSSWTRRSASSTGTRSSLTPELPQGMIAFGHHHTSGVRGQSKKAQLIELFLIRISSSFKSIKESLTDTSFCATLPDQI